MCYKIILTIMCSFLVVASANASSDIYKCKNSSGEISFQQGPCKANETPLKIQSSYKQTSRSSKSMTANPQDMDLDSILKILFEADLNGNMRLNEKGGGSGFTDWIDQLSKFKATDVIIGIKKLWTIQVAKPRRNGAYMWATFAKSSKNEQANNVVNISYGRSSIHHFQIYKSAEFGENSIGPFVSWQGSKRKGRNK